MDGADRGDGLGARGGTAAPGDPPAAPRNRLPVPAGGPPVAVRRAAVQYLGEPRGRGGHFSWRQRQAAWVELLRFLPDVARLLYDLGRDARVPWHGKAAAVGAVAYVISPFDLIPDVLPRKGRLDDIWIVGRALRYLFHAAGYDVMRDRWRGSDDGFALLLVVAGVYR